MIATVPSHSFGIMSSPTKKKSKIDESWKSSPSDRFAGQWEKYPGELGHKKYLENYYKGDKQKVNAKTESPASERSLFSDFVLTKEDVDCWDQLQEAEDSWDNMQPLPDVPT